MPFTINSQQIASARNSALDTLLACAQATLDGIERINALNLETGRKLFASQLENTGRMLSANSLKDALSIQEKIAQPQIDKLAAYAREFQDIASATHGTLIALQDRQYAEFNEAIHTWLDNYAAKSGKDEAAISAVKSAISAANTAFTNAQKAAREVASIAGNSVSATVQAIDTASQSRLAKRKQFA